MTQTHARLVYLLRVHVDWSHSIQAVSVQEQLAISAHSSATRGIPQLVSMYVVPRVHLTGALANRIRAKVQG